MTDSEKSIREATPQPVIAPAKPVQDLEPTLLAAADELGRIMRKCDALEQALEETNDAANRHAQAVGHWIGKYDALRSAQPVIAPADDATWRTPTTYLQRFGDAMQALCRGQRPPDEMLTAWLDADADDHRLQDFACRHGFSWAQGIGLIDAAQLGADHPTEGVKHEMPAAAPLPVIAPAAHIGRQQRIEAAQQVRRAKQRSFDGALLSLDASGLNADKVSQVLRRMANCISSDAAVKAVLEAAADEVNGVA